MAGIYFHIPFCKQACHYCDFHFSTNTSRKADMVRAICQELVLQKEYLGKEIVHTIYFGGGTPSLLTETELQCILDATYQHFSVAPDPEITLEANPDDLTEDKLQKLRQADINRLSIGIQSFHEPHLQHLNRAHNAQEAKACVTNAQNAGFTNLSIDLIYAIPAENHDLWAKDLQTAIGLQPQHISSYCLTIEEKTVFGNWLKKDKIKEADEEFAAGQFEMMVEILAKHGYEQYEISNFCLPGFYSRHNSNYWKKDKYLGIGPSAHSYDGVSRQFNIASNSRYVKALTDNKIDFEKELLQPHDQVNEHILTGLRTKWGCDLQKIQESFAYDLYAQNKRYMDELIRKEMAFMQNQHFILSNKGKLLADRIASDLFIVQ